MVLVIGDRFAQRAQRQVPERIGFGEFPDFFDGVVGGDQLVLSGRVDAVKTRRDGRGAGDAEMDFAGAGRDSTTAVATS